MSITQITREFLGLSSDTKPTNVATGSKFIELDTKKVFIFDGSSWYLNPMPVMVTDSLPTGSNIIGKVGIDSGNNGVSIVGSLANEQKNQADAVANVIVFAANISAIEIYHEEATWQDFIVNGLILKIPAGGWSRPIGGTPAAAVTIPAGINCIVGRLV